MSLGNGERVVFNFGKRPTCYYNYNFRAMNEADPIIQGYYASVTKRILNK